MNGLLCWFCNKPLTHMEGTRYFAHNHDKEIKEAIIANREVIRQLRTQVELCREALRQIQHDIDGAECRDDLDGIKGYIDEALEATANAEKGGDGE